MPAPAEAIMQEVIWKNPEVLAFACALVRHALAMPAPKVDFTTDIVPDTERGTGTGIAGSVVTLLQTANVIQPWGVWALDPENKKAFYPHRLRSERTEAKSRYLNAYRLVSRPLAAEFLSRYEKLVPKIATQSELIAA